MLIKNPSYIEHWLFKYELTTRRAIKVSTQKDKWPVCTAPFKTIEFSIGLWSFEIIFSTNTSVRKHQVNVQLLWISNFLCDSLSAFPFVKTIEDYDFYFQPSIKEEKIKDIINSDFHESGTNIIFIGNPGVGKTHLAI